MTKILKEPLLHFMILGSALFGLFSIANNQGPSDKTIVVTEGKLKQLHALFEKTWQRSPSEAEQVALLNEYIREEVLYREGLDRGLDEDDTVIKRRIRQKFEYFLEGISEQSDPSDDALTAYMQEHKAVFTKPSAYSFRQVYVNPQTHGTNTSVIIEKLKGALTKQDMDASQLGDHTLLQHANGQLDEQKITLAFGGKFLTQLSALEPGQWQGPLESTYGLHMVIIDQQTDGTLPALDEIRDKVRIEWENSVRENARDIYFTTLESEYEIILPE